MRVTKADDSCPLQVPPHVLHAIGMCSRLSSLNLCHQHCVTLEGLQTLGSLTGLRALTLGPCPAVCDEGAALIAQHSALTRLTVHHAAPSGRHPSSSQPFTAGDHVTFTLISPQKLSLCVHGCM